MRLRPFLFGTPPNPPTPLECSHRKHPKGTAACRCQCRVAWADGEDQRRGRRDRRPPQPRPRVYACCYVARHRLQPSGLHLTRRSSSACKRPRPVPNSNIYKISNFLVVACVCFFFCPIRSPGSDLLYIGARGSVMTDVTDPGSTRCQAELPEPAYYLQYQSWC